MKVVLFCGGRRTRMRDYSDRIPKPLVPIGYRPVIWHLMKYYAHFGHTDFILCLGYRGDLIKDYFLNYQETVSNDFVLSGGGSEVELLNADIADWRITFVDTGMTANIGERLRRVRRHLEGEEVFLANYSDGLTDLHLPDLVDYAKAEGASATFLSVRPSTSFHIVSIGGDGRVEAIQESSDHGLWINGGFFVLRQEIFSYMRPDEELVLEPFQRLISERRLCGYAYDGFWIGMDTFKERERLEELHTAGKAPWQVWKSQEDR